ncbi:MAG: 1,2-diacylglycerol 3-alpha-glucosyltransferase [Candidatus Woesearchaeota archaeon]|nr:1,2-diacylglycerol 3-alpha-glucosyltransferase [Candidatus Woesearchaeota archaeon]
MKIVHLCLCSPVTDNFGYQDNLLPKFHKRLGHDVSVITSHNIFDKDGTIGYDERDVYYNEYNIKTIRLKTFFNTSVLFPLRKYKGLYKTIVSEEPDVLFIHGFQFLDITKIKKYAKHHQGVKIFIDSHADFSNSARTFLTKNLLHKIIWKHYARLILPYVDKFYGVLPARVDFLKDVYGLPEEKIELLLMGADDDKVKEAKNPKIREKIRAQNGISKDDFLIMTGGKIDKAKRQTLLLMEAVNQIKDERVKLIVFGSVEDELKDDFFKLVDGERIKYLGWIESDETYKHFASADLVVFPGRHSVFWEQTAALGIPMIVKFWEGTTHVDLGGNCKFLYKDSAEEIKESILELLRDKNLYNNMKKVAQKGIITFSYLNIAKQSLK